MAKSGFFQFIYKNKNKIMKKETKQTKKIKNIEKRIKKNLIDRFIFDLIILRDCQVEDNFNEKQLKQYTNRYKLPIYEYTNRVEFTKNINKINILKDDEVVVFEYYKNSDAFINNNKGVELVELLNEWNIPIFPFI